MTSSGAATVEEYLAGLPEDRRAAISAVREVILANLPEGYAEQMQYGMIGYVVPHSIHPAGYHCDPKQPLPFAGLGSQKSHVALHLMCVYLDEELRRWFEEAYAASGKKLDMGKACLRFKKQEDVALEVLGQLIARVPVDAYIARHQAILETARAARKK
jgi:uncharacterized protein YdhG (YjbR/CyaY superfamily)